jgi:hypothetical protein
MRGAGALAAAALLALALCAPGCNLVDSLTPFGVGTRDYASENSGVNLNGTWNGLTASGGGVGFQVGSDTVSDLTLHYAGSGCTLPFEASLTAPIVNGAFTLEENLATGGRFVATGTFNSSTTVSGSYFFEGLPAGSCPSAGTETFSATKITL